MRSGELAEEVARLSPRIRIHPTAGKGDARRIARELSLAGKGLVVAAGGDGTMNEVVNGLADAGCRSALGLLPTGTMNVFAHELGLPCASLHLCWELIEGGSLREADLWTANGHCFAQLAGVGLDAAVIAGTTWEAKKKLGPLSYMINAVRLLRGESPEFTVTVPGREPLRGRVVLLGNGSRYGGPFRVFPQASFSDGLVDVLVVERHGWRELWPLARGLLTGRYSGQGVTLLQADSVSITAEGAVPFEVDGELGGTTPVEIRRHPSKLWVIGRLP